MKLGESGTKSAFGDYPFDASVVCGKSIIQQRWQPVSRLMAIPPVASDQGNRALGPSIPILGSLSAKANWPPSVRREEAKVLSNLKKQVGFYKVRNTSTFKNISVSFQKDKDENDQSSSSTKSNDLHDLDNRTFLRKILSSRPLNRINNIRDCTTDWSSSDFVTECLCWHNVYRERHGSPPLALCPDLCRYAQEWANTLAHMNILFYRPKAKDVGQNIYCRLNVKPHADVTGQEVAGHWYSEYRQYNFLKEPDVFHANINSGHFTQLIWANSCKVGIGIARSRNGKVMVVANYRPPGNILGKFQDNVFPPILECNTDGSSQFS